MPFENITYTTRPSQESSDQYITVYFLDDTTPGGSYVSRHRNMEECTESALEHAQTLSEGDHFTEGTYTYRFVPPEKHMSLRILSPASGGGALPAEASESGGTSALSWSAPNGLGDNQTLIIETDGTNDFGSGPDLANVWYEDFRDQTAGQNYDTSLNDHVTVQRTDGPPSVVDNEAFVGDNSFNASFLNDGRNALIIGVDDVNGPNGLMLFTEWFSYYALKLVGAENGTGNQKPIWTMLGPGGFQNNNADEGNDIFWIGNPGANGSLGTAIGGNNTASAGGVGNHQVGEWNVHTGWIKLINANDRENHTQEIRFTVTAEGLGGLDRTEMAAGRTNFLATTDYPPGQPAAWDQHIFSGFSSNRDGSTVTAEYLDLGYFAHGANALAHVVIGDHSDFATRAKAVLAKPVSWTSTRIEVVMNQGNLTDLSGSTAVITKADGTEITLDLT